MYEILRREAIYNNPLYNVIDMLRFRWRDPKKAMPESIIPARPTEDVDTERVADLQPTVVDILAGHPDFEAAVRRHGYVKEPEK